MLEGITLKERYRLDRRIGGGVFQAADLESGRDVAIRILPFGAGAARMDPAALARRRERVAAAVRLRHPNLVTFHEAGTSEALGMDFVAMELLRGEELRQRGGPLAWQQASRILSDAARGLGAAHGAGVVHGALTPDTLFLEHDAQGTPLRARVLDLGTAREDEGPHPYTAPERRRGGDPTPAADVWSLGAVAYEMLTGRVPFGEQQLGALAGGARVHLDPPSSVARDVPAAVDDLVARSLSPDPRERPADAQAFARELESARNGAKPSPSPAPAAPRVEVPERVAARAASILRAVGESAEAAPAAPSPFRPPPPAAADSAPPPSPAPQQPAAGTAATAGAPGRRRGFPGMILAVVSVAAVAVFSIALAGRSLESREEYLQAALPVEAAREPRDGEIDHIKAVFNRIDVQAHTIREWRMELGRLRRFEWPSADSAHATVYEDRNGIQKIRVRTYENGERTLSLIFYYDYGNKLLFVFEIRPSGGGRRAEQRFYFSGRSLVAWRDTRNEVVPLGPEYEEFAVRLHRISDRLLELAAHARR